jgi:hypothetical protein
MPSTSFADRIEDVEEVPGAAGQPVQASYQQDIPGTKGRYGAS